LAGLDQIDGESIGRLLEGGPGKVLADRPEYFWGGCDYFGRLSKVGGGFSTRELHAGTFGKSGQEKLEALVRAKGFERGNRD